MVVQFIRVGLDWIGLDWVLGQRKAIADLLDVDVEQFGWGPGYHFLSPVTGQRRE